MTGIGGSLVGDRGFGSGCGFGRCDLVGVCQEKQQDSLANVETIFRILF